MNPDVNSGNPIGISIAVCSTDNKFRTTSASAYLSEKPENLTVYTNSPVAKIKFDGKEAVGVQLRDGSEGYSQSIFIEHT